LDKNATVSIRVGKEFLENAVFASKQSWATPVIFGFIFTFSLKEEVIQGAKFIKLRKEGFLWHGKLPLGKPLRSWRH
jgi:hypothetical protein